MSYGIRPGLYIFFEPLEQSFAEFDFQFPVLRIVCQVGRFGGIFLEIVKLEGASVGPMNVFVVFGADHAQLTVFSEDSVRPVILLLATQHRCEALSGQISAR